VKNLLRLLKSPRRVFWILLQGAFLPLVVKQTKYEGTTLGTILFILYMVLVLVDAVITVAMFEPKDKA
jgi:hypothetical protein